MYAGAGQESERRVEPLAEALEGKGIVPAIVGVVEEEAPGIGAPFVRRSGNRLDRRPRWRELTAGARVPGSGRDVLVAAECGGLPDRVHPAEPVLDEAGRVAMRAD